VAVERPGNCRQRSRDHEGQHLIGRNIDTEPLRDLLVETDRLECPSDFGTSDVLVEQPETDQHDQQDRNVVGMFEENEVACSRTRKLEAGRPTRQRLPSEPRLFHHERERNGRHGEIQAAEPERGESDHERECAAGQRCSEEPHHDRIRRIDR
jgi:hypothetical protein